jgi:hypothetical protein
MQVWLEMIGNFRRKRARQHQEMLSAVIMHPRTHVVDVRLQCDAAHGHDIEHGRRHRDVALEFALGPVGETFQRTVRSSNMAMAAV